MMPRCMLCNDQVKKNEFEPRLAFQFTPEQLEFAAYLENCESCLVILEGLRQSEPRGWSLKRDVKLVDATCRGKRDGFEDTLKLEIFFNDDRPKLELEYYNLQPHAFRGILPRNKTSGHPLSQQALDWISNALVRCRNEHKSCMKPNQPLLPKRLIELGTTFYGATTIRLIETTHEQGEYVALSHCWGKEQTCITTTANLSGRKKGIQWSSIPKTFQEAMKLTQQLGFKYIWIDSLCIIQDDDADWETQSARMWEIYQDAVLTLAATSSAGDNEGCCLRNDRLPDLELDHLPDTIGTYRIAVRQPHNHWDVGTSHARKKHFPLLTRGWAFQERLLSPRVLHISESELVWECREWSQCECGGLSQQRSPGGDYYHAVEENEEEKRVHDIAQQQRLDLEARMTELHIQTQQNQDIPPSYEDAVLAQETMPGPPSPASDVEVDPIAFLSQTNVPIYEDTTTTANDLSNLKDCPNLVFHFHRVVESYSALDLTRPSDRLPALSGLCKRVQHIRNNYLAGLWSDSVCFDLLWRVETIRLSTPTNGARADEYRGPTWSWISVDSPVRYWDEIINFRDAYTGFKPNVYRAAGQHADQIEMSVTVPGQNPFGTVTSAVIKLKASATTAMLRYTQCQDTQWRDEKGRVLSSGSHDPVRYKLELLTVPWWAVDEWDAEGRPALPSQRPTPIPVDIPFWPDYSLSAEGESMVPADTKVTLLLVHPKVCLVLRPKKGKKWERIGIAKISETMLNYYKIDWMQESEVLKFRIV